MVKELSSTDALLAYQSVLRCFDEHGNKHNHNFEIQDLILHQKYSAHATSDLKKFLELLFESEPLKLWKGLRKAERAYTRKGDRITKPSYISRVRSYPDFSKRTQLVSTIDQIKSVARAFCEEPNASYHVISIFRPIDLLEKFRPGYVPCVICADFKYRAKTLHGKFFFRSCDAYNLLPFDLFYCIGIAQQLIDQIKMNGFAGTVELGHVLFWFSRIYVSRFDIPHRVAMLKQIDEFYATQRFHTGPRRKTLKRLRAPTESASRYE